MKVQGISNQNYNQSFNAKFRSTQFMDKMLTTVSEVEKDLINKNIKYIESFNDGKIYVFDKFSKNMQRHTAAIFEILNINGKEKKVLVTSGIRQNPCELFENLASGYKFRNDMQTYKSDAFYALFD